MEVARYGTNGSLDPTFGSGGRVTTLFGEFESSQAQALTVQTDGTLLVAGIAGSFTVDSFLQVRYLANGSLDPNFAGDGHIRTPFYSSRARVNAVAAQPDGKLVAAGYAATQCNSLGCGSNQFAVSRYLPTGTVDTTFGTGGTVLTGFPNGPAEARAVAIQPDGKIVVAGEGTTDWPGPGVALARYLPDGTLDSSFGTGGRVLSNPDPADYQMYANALVLQPDGNIVISGTAGSSGLLTARFPRRRQSGHHLWLSGACHNPGWSIRTRGVCPGAPSRRQAPGGWRHRIYVFFLLQRFSADPLSAHRCPGCRLRQRRRGNHDLWPHQ